MIPTHWDNFRLPYGYSQQADFERNIVPFIQTAAELAPDTRVIPPVHLEPIVIN